MNEVTTAEATIEAATAKMAATMQEAAVANAKDAKAKADTKAAPKPLYPVEVDHSRDALLTEAFAVLADPATHPDGSHGTTRGDDPWPAPACGLPASKTLASRARNSACWRD